MDTIDDAMLIFLGGGGGGGGGERKVRIAQPQLVTTQCYFHVLKSA